MTKDEADRLSKLETEMSVMTVTLIGRPGTDDKGLCGAVRTIDKKMDSLKDLLISHIQDGPQNCKNQLQYCAEQRARIHERIDNVEQRGNARLDKVTKIVWIIAGMLLAGGGVTGIIQYLV